MAFSKQVENPQLAALRQWPGLGGCSDVELRALSKLVDEVSFPSEHVLMRAGQPGREAFMILSGSVKVEVDGAIVATLGPGRFVGEMALLENDVRTATVTTTEPTTALVLSRKAFVEIVGKPGVSARIATELARRVRELEGGPSWHQ